MSRDLLTPTFRPPASFAPQAGSSNANPMMDFYLKQKPILEINARHPLIQRLKEQVDEGAPEVQCSVRLQPGEAGRTQGRQAAKVCYKYKRQCVEFAYARTTNRRICRTRCS
jgi:hypothetical protein